MVENICPGCGTKGRQLESGKNYSCDTDRDECGVWVFGNGEPPWEV